MVIYKVILSITDSEVTLKILFLSEFVAFVGRAVRPEAIIAPVVINE